ncbi:WYL domain-containing protein [Pedobacter sp. FW305-3-2-15-E-R2A2]|uniref:helix-turn-helix transcriptional regulator n=1 Tax=Pedobacter sp. FW305-3-2-15-E-R2A2 TaxID=3140251 RepID=UPI003140A2E0
MPVNRNALLRYRTIDQCLQNRRRKWSLEDLITACSDALYEYQGIDTGVSRRSIQADLEMMRSNKLGYEAPIVVVDRKYYTYADKDYSITNSPLNQQDMQVLNEVSHLLSQFKGFSHFADLNEMLSKLEDKIYAQEMQTQPLIDFEKNDDLKGLEYIEVIRKAIVARQTLGITYQSFKAKKANELNFSPYLLKEYRNRWFVIGVVQGSNALLYNLALDRIQSISEGSAEYQENNIDDFANFYHNVIGVSKYPHQKDTEVIFWSDQDNAPYMMTKPLHRSQRLIREEKDGKVFSIQVVLNFELERELLGFGAKVKVLSPEVLVLQMKEHLKNMMGHYEMID